MTNYVARILLQRIFWPAIIIICSLMRPVGVSIIYLLMFFILPYVPVATSKNIKGFTGAYFIISITLSATILLLHLGLQIAILILGIEAIAEKCSITEILLRHIGFINLVHLKSSAVIEWILPEVLICSVSILLYSILKKLATVPKTGNDHSNIVEVAKTSSSHFSENLQLISPFASLCSLLVAGILRPSIPGGIYFMTFLFGGTLWACCKKLNGAFRTILRIVLLILIVHSMTILTYQTPWPQELLRNSSLPARLSGLEPLLISTCGTDDIRIISFNKSVNFDSYLNPVSLLICYYITALFSTNLKIKAMNNSKQNDRSSNEVNIELEHVPEETLNSTEPTIVEEFLLGFKKCRNFLYLNSYIFTSIVMMAWSIIYHSWLTFVLLLWANLLWMIPNQRKAMLNSSPFIVLYAELLLVAQYVYGMDLTDEELPSSIEMVGINLQQIGFIKPARYPSAPLILKTLFTTVFWTTTRQLYKENSDMRQSSASKVSNIFIDEEENTRDVRSSSLKKTGAVSMDKVGEFFKSSLMKLWIWLLLLVIFLCGIAGQRMTGFRICYMALFLFFVLAFQLSWRFWAKIMYGYWIVVVIYATIILILIYTYQFDQFDAHWKNFFGISITLQKDIGLEKYKTKELFLHLVNPTVIVVMTAIQVHYFHDDFIKSLTLTSDAEKKSQELFVSNDAEEEDVEDSKDNRENNRKFFQKISRREIIKVLKSISNSGNQILDYVWIFAEIHLMKLILIVTFWCCLENVCFLHILFSLLVVISVVSRIRVQIVISRIIAVLMSVLLLSKMIYQVDYINHKNYDAACDENSTISLIDVNNAVWFGLSKITEATTLEKLLRSYIFNLVIITLHAVVLFRQGCKRSLAGMDNKTPIVIFEGVTRDDAEKSLTGLLKFLLNYTFYKFGYELSLIMLVIVISHRQDILAVFYVMWLCALFKLNRSSCSKLWVSFQTFVAVMIILQYVLFVGLPPGLCMEWPWYNSPYINGLQSWALIPGPHLHKQTTKLMFDFVLLIFVYRQHRVFILEKKFADLNLEHPAGLNKTIVDDADGLNIGPLKNPVPDFVSNARNWLDVLKKAVLNGCFWFALAFVFLAGTSVISLFSIGYLIGSFIFLWQGTDFYLRPMKSIIKWWLSLIAYNIFVISLKTALQIGGCLFLNSLEHHACWFVHLFSVSCLQDTIAESLGGITTPTNECPEILDEIGLTWDVVCFAFLIFQFRIFKSNYFHHLVNDTKATATLASRGAELIEDLRNSQIEQKKRHEVYILRKIKQKMEKIRSKQEKPVNYVGDQTHYSAIRAGDYYMFDDIDEQVELEIEETGDDYTAAGDKTKGKLFESCELMEIQNTQDTTETDASGKIKKCAERSLPRKILDGLLMYLLARLNQTSKNYRYVSKILEKEKHTLKGTKGLSYGARSGEGYMWTPFKHKHQVEMKIDDNESVGENFGSKNRHIFIKICVAVWYAILANTDILCFIAALVNQIISASLLSLIIPLMIFLWGTLSIPRPTKTFWITLIAYTQTVVLIKCVFQFKMIWFNQSPDAMTTAKIIGIQFTDGAAGYDLVFLLTLFFHRFLLKSQGLWKSEYKADTVDDGAYKLLGETAILDEIESTDTRLAEKYTKNKPNSGWYQNKTQHSFTQFNLAVYLAKIDFSKWKHFKVKHLTTEEIILESFQREPELSLAKVIIFDKAGKEIAVIKKDDETIILSRQNPGDAVIDENECVHVSTFIEEPGSYLPEVIKTTSSKYCSPIVIFLQDLLHKARLPTDVYAYMFLCDFINFFVLLFGFSAFDNQRADGGVQTYLEENRVPISFLIMLVLHFVLILIDRALYLRRAVKFRLGFHLFLVLSIHVWMFFIIPSLQGRAFNSQTPTVIFYLVKCVYFFLSSYQLCCGYPNRITGNFFAKGYSIVHMIAFRIYMAIPLLYELRTLLDWVCTETTMTLFEWLKMEDMFAEIFIMKCARQMESDLPVVRGGKKPLLTKAIMGGSMIFLLSFLIWGPFMIFALSSAVGISNVPYDVSISLRIGPYEPVYEMSAQDTGIHTFDETMMTEFETVYGKNKAAMTFLSDYDHQDVAAIVLGASSASLWNISPPDSKRFLDDLEKNSTLTCRLRYTVSRKSFEKEHPATTFDETTFELTSDHPGRIGLMEMIQGNTPAYEVKLPGLLPKFIKVKSNGDLKTVPQLMPVNIDFRDITVRYYVDNTTDSSWWQMNEFCKDPYYEHVLTNLPLSNCESKVVLYTFSDKLFPSYLSVFTAGGIIGMYTTIVLVGSKILRGMIMGSSRRIMFEELPYVDRMLQLCLDIYLVREAMEFSLEEDLFAKLLFLYRSPETLIKWTRPKQNEISHELDEAASSSGSKKKED